MYQATVRGKDRGSLPLTFADNETGSRTAEPNIPTGFVDNRRVVPFFDIRLPEGLTFSPRGNGLVPGSLLGDGYVLAKEEVDNEVNLSPYGQESSD